MKTRKPLILTAHIAEQDLVFFDRLRQAHFPPNRNHLNAHLTMFHRLPGEHDGKIRDALFEVASTIEPFGAEVDGLRHLGAGVAFTIRSPELEVVRAALNARFKPWLGPQDLQSWQPHITIQNKVAKPTADVLYAHLRQEFRPRAIEISGLDLWAYLGGPWRHAALASFAGTTPSAAARAE